MAKRIASSQSDDSWGEDEFEMFDPAEGAGGEGVEDETEEDGDEDDGFGFGSSSDATDERMLEDAIQACATLEQRLLREPMINAANASASFETQSYGQENIVGVGVGEGPDGRPRVEVYVGVMPESRSQFASEAMVSPQIDGVPVEYVEVGEFTAQVNPRLRYRPAPGGTSIGPCDKQWSGTYGCLVRRGRELFVLSNHHVIVGNCNGSGRRGKPISQPSIPDGGRCPRDIIARLSEFVPIDYAGRANRVDAAIAKTSPRLVRPEILGIGRPASANRRPTLGMNVIKTGRTTGRTAGRITAINVSVRVNYPGCGVALFTGQFIVRSHLFLFPFSRGGDSGSLVMSTGCNPVGLLFAGNGTDTICNPIGEVLNRLNVSIVR